MGPGEAGGTGCLGGGDRAIAGDGQRAGPLCGFGGAGDALCFNAANFVLELPVAALHGITCLVRACRNVGAGERSQAGNEGLPVSRPGDVAAVEQDIGFATEGAFPALYLIGASGQRCTVKLGRSQLQHAIAAVRDDMDGVDGLTIGQRRADLVDAIAAGVDQYDIEGVFA